MNRRSVVVVLAEASRRSSQADGTKTAFSDSTPMKNCTVLHVLMYHATLIWSLHDELREMPGGRTRSEQHARIPSAC